MKFLILVLSLAAAPALAEPCSGTIALGNIQLNGQCVNSACQVQWGGLVSGNLSCGSLRATVEGALNGISQAVCSNRVTSIEIGGAAIELQGKCSNGQKFLGRATIGAAATVASCQENGPAFGSANGALSEVTGNCL